MEFAFTIETAIQKVLKMPTSYPIRHNKVRIAHPKTFPYNIHFYIDDVHKTIVFTAIIHNKRQPEFALNRF